MLFLGETITQIKDAPNPSLKAKEKPSVKKSTQKGLLGLRKCPEAESAVYVTDPAAENAKTEIGTVVATCSSDSVAFWRSFVRTII